MTAIDVSTAATSDDSAAIAELHDVFATQRAAFLADPAPSLAARQERLMALAGMMLANRERIREAMTADFAVHPELFTDLIETLGIAGRAAYVVEQLEGWMAPEERYADPALYGTARAAMRYEPKGVVGNISPWNFPFDLSVGPLVEILAAGNRAILKPSELTPTCSALLAEMVADTFDRDLVAVVTGGVDLAIEFPKQRWDHLLYTGNPEVGRKVALAAAENLVPVTLELGGKCPAVLHTDSVDAETVAQILGTKLIKNGQMCISVDYCLVPEDEVGHFVELAQAHFETHLPDYASGPDCTGIVSDRHLQRVSGLLDEARAAGSEIVQLGDGEVNLETRQMPLSLVVDPDESLRLTREEIFGPILPIVPYASLDDAIGNVNAGERPLGLYVFAKDTDAADRVLNATSSGGACVNTCALQGALPALGFGGVGQSGTGRHHGIDGFREFSNPRGVVIRGEGDLVQALQPPYGDLAQAVVDSALNQG